MGWLVGYDPKWKRDIGYGVPSICDHPDCATKIDRGLSYVCGGEPYGGDAGCGLFLCDQHLGYAYADDGDDLLNESGEALPQMCEPCIERHKHPERSVIAVFPPKPDVPEWINHKLTDPSWHQWRNEHPDWVLAASGAAMRCICGHSREDHAFDENHPERYSECWHRYGNCLCPGYESSIGKG